MAILTGTKSDATTYQGILKRFGSAALSFSEDIKTGRVTTDGDNDLESILTDLFVSIGAAVRATSAGDAALRGALAHVQDRLDAIEQYSPTGYAQATAIEDEEGYAFDIWVGGFRQGSNAGFHAASEDQTITRNNLEAYASSLLIRVPHSVNPDIIQITESREGRVIVRFPNEALSWVPARVGNAEDLYDYWVLGDSASGSVALVSAIELGDVFNMHIAEGQEEAILISRVAANEEAIEALQDAVAALQAILDIESGDNVSLATSRMERRLKMGAGDDFDILGTSGLDVSHAHDIVGLQLDAKRTSNRLKGTLVLRKDVTGVSFPANYYYRINSDGDLVPTTDGTDTAPSNLAIYLGSGRHFFYTHTESNQYREDLSKAHTLTVPNDNYGEDLFHDEADEYFVVGLALDGYSLDPATAFDDTTAVPLVSGGSGQSATIQSITVDDQGRITAVVWANRGSGYSAGDVLTLTQGDISAVYTLLGANVSGGALQNFSNKTIGGAFTADITVVRNEGADEALFEDRMQMVFTRIAAGRFALRLKAVGNKSDHDILIHDIFNKMNHSINLDAGSHTNQVLVNGQTGFLIPFIPNGHLYIEIDIDIPLEEVESA